MILIFVLAPLMLCRSIIWVRLVTWTFTQHQKYHKVVLDYGMSFILSSFRTSQFIKNLLGRETFPGIWHALIKETKQTTSGYMLHRVVLACCMCTCTCVWGRPIERQKHTTLYYRQAMPHQTCNSHVQSLDIYLP